jgi:hypothetical protein
MNDLHLKNEEADEKAKMKMRMQIPISQQYSFNLGTCKLLVATCDETIR